MADNGFGNGRWLDIRRACAETSMSKKTLRKYLNSGEIYGTKKGGKIYVDRFSIDAFFLADAAKVEKIVNK